MVSKAIMFIVENEDSVFDVVEGTEYRVFHHKKSVKAADGSRPNAHSFWVQPSEVTLDPPYPADCSYWQQCLNSMPFIANERINKSDCKRMAERSPSSPPLSEQRPRKTAALNLLKIKSTKASNWLTHSQNREVLRTDKRREKNLRLCCENHGQRCTLTFHYLKIYSLQTNPPAKTPL